MTYYEGYLIDLDGTMYNGTEPIESAVQFVRTLHSMGIPYLFVTNNSSSTPEEVAKKLQNMGVPATKEQVVTSSLATAGYIHKQKPNARCYVIGEDGLKQALIDQGLFVNESIESEGVADYVIVGIDRSVTYEKYIQACLHVRAGATFISTNGDKAIPTERGMLPGNGALTSVVTFSTGVNPIYIGKPEEAIMQEAMERIGLSKEVIAMVGDNYDTDILAGIHAGIPTIMVLTGVTPESTLSRFEQQPIHILKDLSQWRL